MKIDEQAGHDVEADKGYEAGEGSRREPVGAPWTLRIGEAVLDLDHTAIIAPLTDEKVLETLEPDRLTAAGVEMLEWRMDRLVKVSAADPDGYTRAYQAMLTRLLEVWGHRPHLVTLRSREEGGAYDGTREEALRLLTLTAERPEIQAIDAELLRLTKEEASELAACCRRSGTVLIGSSHVWKEAPDTASVRDRLLKLRACGADLPKVAYRAYHPLDALYVLRGGYEASVLGRAGVIAIAMGEPGKLSRVGGAAYGQAATFAVPPDWEASAPGQWDLATLSALLGRPTGSAKGRA